MLTASNFGLVCRRQIRSLTSNLVNEILYWKPTRGKVLEALDYGKDNESLAIHDLSEHLKVEITKSGFIIDDEIPFLGASPDGCIALDFNQLDIAPEKIMNIDLLSTMETSAIGGIIEIKCPITAKNAKTEAELLQVPAVEQMFDKKNPNIMNRNHCYYCQVQGALHISECNYCIFCVWTPYIFKYIAVIRDDAFWTNKMEDKLKNFYNNCLRPEILDSRVKRNLKIREPSYIEKAQRQKFFNKANRSEKMEIELSLETKNLIDDMNITENESEDFKALNKNNNVCSENFEFEVSNESDNYEVVDDDIKISKITTGTRKVRKIPENVPSDEYETIIEDVYGLLDEVCMDKFISVLNENSTFDVLSVQHMFFPDLIPPFNRVFPMNQDLQIIIGGGMSGHWRCIYYDGNVLHIWIVRGQKN